MLIKKLTIIFLIGLALVGLTYYYINTLSPFDLEKLQDYAIQNEIQQNDFDGLDSAIQALIEEGVIADYFSPNAYVGLAMALIALLCFFVVIHVVVDKLFFREFYEEPSFFDAIRRGLLLCTSIALALYFKLLNLETHEIILMPILFLIIEVGFDRFFKEDLLKSVSAFKNQLKELSNKAKQT